VGCAWLQASELLEGKAQGLKRDKATLGVLGLILKLDERKRSDGEDVVSASRGRSPADASQGCMV